MLLLACSIFTLRDQNQTAAIIYLFKWNIFDKVGQERPWLKCMQYLLGFMGPSILDKIIFCLSLGLCIFNIELLGWPNWTRLDKHYFKK